MVLESLSNPYNAEMHPGWIFVHGLIYAIVGLLISVIVFPEYASIVMVFLITAAGIPLIYNLIKYEEEKDYANLEERILIKEHGKAVKAYLMLFLGITAALTLAFILLPETLINKAFAAQISTYQSINPSHTVTGQVTAQVTGINFFSHIFINNVKVLVWCIIFSFLYGAGAIFILTWNASVIALAIGNTLRMKASAIAAATGMPLTAAYLSQSFQVIVLRYGIHGILEIIAYILAGLAGGIISVAVIRHHYKSEKFEHIVIDSADLILIALAILFVGGVWEAFITPAFY